jgi:hypothetical protein
VVVDTVVVVDAVAAVEVRLGFESSFVLISISCVLTSRRHFFQEVASIIECWNPKISPRCIIMLPSIACHDDIYLFQGTARCGFWLDRIDLTAAQCRTDSCFRNRYFRWQSVLGVPLDWSGWQTVLWLSLPQIAPRRSCKIAELIVDPLAYPAV